MRKVSVLLVPLALGCMLIAGCTSSRSSAVPGAVLPDSLRAQGDTVHTRAVHVLVDGKDQGMLPATLRVRRSFGARVVSLWQAGKEIRHYELQTYYTADGMATEQGFWANDVGGERTYDVRTLPTKKRDDNYFFIPYSPRPITVEDNVYQLILIVED